MPKRLRKQAKNNPEKSEEITNKYIFRMGKIMQIYYIVVKNQRFARWVCERESIKKRAKCC